MNEHAPVPPASRFLVWTDHTAERYPGAQLNLASWFWSASGPRGHMSGAESTSEAASERAYAAFLLLRGAHEGKAQA